MMHSFDDRIKERFSDYSPEMPPHIWENIVAKKKKRRAFFWIWPLLIIGTALIGLGVRQNAKRISTTEEKMSISPGENKIETENAGNKINPHNPTLETIESEAAHHIDNLGQSSEKTLDKGSADIPEKTADSYENKLVTSAAAKNPKTESNIKAATEIFNYPEKQVRENSSIGKSFYAKVSQKSGGRQRPYMNRPDENHITQAPVNFSLPESDSRDKGIEKISLANRELQSFSFKIIPPKIGRQEIPCPERNAAGNKKYLEVYAGPDMVFRSFRDTGHSEYLRIRKESTSIAFAYSAGTRFTKVFNNGMSFRSGINYSHIREKFTLADGSAIRTVFILDANGDTIGNYSTSGTLYRRSFNRYNTVDIPLLIGYEMGNGRLHTNVNAGVIVNAYSWQKGLVVDTANKAVNITTGSDPSPYQFKKNIGVGFLGSVSFYYKMNERMHLLAEPYFRYNLSAFNKEEITLKQKFHNAGLRLGIRYELK